MTNDKPRVFVCPETPDDKLAFAEAAKHFKPPPPKKQPQTHVPRGGLRGRIMRH